MEQLLHSELWFINNYGRKFKQKLILFHSDAEKEAEVQFSDNMFIVPKDKLFRLKDNIEQLKQLLYSNFDNLTRDKLQEYFHRTGLGVQQIEQNFFKKAKQNLKLS
ncbi:TPA: hypothetical protein VBA78_001392 [Streptococcus agalactiae]|nr:hypothetical protein [Streptococcus agalactiae]